MLTHSIPILRANPCHTQYPCLIHKSDTGQADCERLNHCIRGPFRNLLIRSVPQPSSHRNRPDSTPRPSLSSLVLPPGHHGTEGIVEVTRCLTVRDCRRRLSRSGAAGKEHAAPVYSPRQRNADRPASARIEYSAITPPHHQTKQKTTTVVCPGHGVQFGAQLSLRSALGTASTWSATNSAATGPARRDLLAMYVVRQKAIPNGVPPTSCSHDHFGRSLGVSIEAKRWAPQV